MQRRVPLRRKRLTPRRSKTVPCSHGRCKRRPAFEGLCRTHIRLELDRIVGSLVRARGECEVCGNRVGPFNWAHGFSRRYLAIRWSLLNGFCLDRSCDYRMTMNPLRWDQFLREKWGESVYEELRMVALSSVEPPDYAEVLRGLRDPSTS